MIHRIWRAFSCELMKATRLKSTYAGPVLVTIAVFGALLVQPVARDGISDYAFIAYATPMALNLLGLLLIVIYCAGLVSSVRSLAYIP